MIVGMSFLNRSDREKSLQLTNKCNAIIKLLTGQGDQDAIEKLKHRREYNYDYCRRYREKKREEVKGEVSCSYTL